eukprot:UN21126
MGSTIRKRMNIRSKAEQQCILWPPMVSRQSLEETNIEIFNIKSKERSRIIKNMHTEPINQLTFFLVVQNLLYSGSFDDK